MSVGAAFDDGAVVLSGPFGAATLRTSNDGATWEEVELPPPARLSAMTARGTAAWACTADGRVVHSTDSGRSWTALQSAPTSAEDRCVSLDFPDARHGWLVGWRGSLWSTDDGGASWKRATLPKDFAPSRVVWASATLGFVHGLKGSLRTRDGGASWEVVDVPTDAPRVVQRLGPHAVLVTRESAEAAVEQRAFVLSPRVSPRGRGAVSLEGERLVLWAAEGTRELLELRGTASGEQPRLERVRTQGSLHSTVGKRRAFLSSDEGKTWTELAPLPGEAAFDAFVMLDARRALARSAGQVFRSDDAGRGWQPSSSPLDAMELAFALGEAKEPPLSCLRAERGTLSLRFGTEECFGGSERQLTLEWDPSGGSLLRPAGKEPQRLTTEEARKLLRELHERATRAEVPSTSRSTTKVSLELELTCHLDGRRERQAVQLQSNECDERATGTYARVCGMYDWARAR
ncbi:MAG: WD40/YVTN/BNR-like repeat-containing protein [Myxococcota bacterium]